MSRIQKYQISDFEFRISNFFSSTQPPRRMRDEKAGKLKTHNSKLKTRLLEQLK